MKPQCATQAEVFTEFARISKLAEGSELSLRVLFKYDGSPVHNEPYSEYCMLGDYEKYSFALAIVEGNPVFPGDTLYSVHYKEPVRVRRITEYGIYVDGTTVTGTRFRDEVKLTDLAWQAPGRTFILNGEELPFPEDTNNGRIGSRKWYYIPEDVFTHFRWDTIKDRDKVQAAILKLLKGE